MWRKKDSQKKKKSVWSTVWKMLNRNVLFLVSWADSQGGHCVLLFIFLTLYTPAICWGKNDQDNLFLENQTKTRQPYSFYISVLPILYFCFSYNLAICWGEGGDGQPYCIIHFLFFFYYIFFLHPLCNLLEKELGQHLFYFCFLFMFLFSTSTCNLVERGLGQPCLFYFVFLILHTPCNFLGKKRTITFFFFLFFFFLFFGGRNSILFYASLKSCRELKQDRTKPLHLTVNWL